MVLSQRVENGSAEVTSSTEKTESFGDSIERPEGCGMSVVGTGMVEHLRPT